MSIILEFTSEEAGELLEAIHELTANTVIKDQLSLRQLRSVKELRDTLAHEVERDYDMMEETPNV